MTIENKDWYYDQTLRLSLSGFSQEQIARELQVSEGTINAIMRDLMNSDETLRLQHEIAVVSKKSGVPVGKLAANLAFANAIKLRALEDNKIEYVLRAIDSFCAKDASYDPDATAILFIEFCDLAIKNRSSPDSLVKELKSKYNELSELVKQSEREKVILSQIKEASKTELENHNVDKKTLQDFLNLKEDFKNSGLNFDKRDEILNVLYNLSVNDNDADKIIDEVKQIRLLNFHRARVLDECDKAERILQNYHEEIDRVKRNMNLYAHSADVISTLLGKGNSPQSILKIFDIWSKHPHLSPDQFGYDIDTYGGMVEALHKKFLDCVRTNTVTAFPAPYSTNTDTTYTTDITQKQMPA